jgi:hypothetical protein
VHLSIKISFTKFILLSGPLPILTCNWSRDLCGMTANLLQCDEGQPACGHCLKRNLRCRYLPVETDLSAPPTPVRATPPGLYPGGMQRELHQPDRTIELALFHQFSTVTYRTLKEDERSDHHLQVVIPRLALSHDYLLDTILALSALHTEYLDVCITRYWLHIALDYQHRALLAFNNALAHITPRNCEPIAVCSMLMIILVMAIPGVSEDGSPPDPASEILGLRNLLQGITHILCQSEDTLRKGELWPWFQPIFEPKPKISRESQLTSLDSLDCDQLVNEQASLAGTDTSAGQAQIKSLCTGRKPRIPIPLESKLMKEDR